jgi:DNA-binding response OmpR family regulator
MPADDRVLLLGMRAAERSRLEASISRLGYVVLHAEDLEAAQAIRQREVVAIMLVGLSNQPTPIAELREQMPGSAVIMLGARTLAAALDAWYAGADGYLPRPVRQNELTDALEHALRVRAARDAEPEPARPAVAEFRRLAAELARQLNTPLAPLLGWADLLAAELPPNHPGSQYAQAIADAALRIRDIAWMLADIGQLKE